MMKCCMECRRRALGSSGVVPRTLGHACASSSFCRCCADDVVPTVVGLAPHGAVLAEVVGDLDVAVHLSDVAMPCGG